MYGLFLIIFLLLTLRFCRHYIFFGRTEMLEHTQSKVMQQPDCGNGHTLTTLLVP